MAHCDHSVMANWLLWTQKWTRPEAGDSKKLTWRGRMITSSTIIVFMGIQPHTRAIPCGAPSQKSGSHRVVGCDIVGSKRLTSWELKRPLTDRTMSNVEESENSFDVPKYPKKIIELWYSEVSKKNNRALNYDKICISKSKLKLRMIYDSAAD